MKDVIGEEEGLQGMLSDVFDASTISVMTFNKSGDKFKTGSYDRTCKVWDTMTGEETEMTDIPEGTRERNVTVFKRSSTTIVPNKEINKEDNYEEMVRKVDNLRGLCS